MSEYKIKKVEKLPPSRVGVYDKIVRDLEGSEKGIYEITVEGRKANNIVTSLKNKLDPEKFEVSMRSGRCFIEVL